MILVANKIVIHLMDMDIDGNYFILTTYWRP